MGSVIRRGDLKYIHHYDDDAHELYDLAADLGERRNLAGARPAAAAAMRRELTAWLREVGAELPRPYAEIPAGEEPWQEAPLGGPQGDRVEAPVRLRPAALVVHHRPHVVTLDALLAEPAHLLELQQVADRGPAPSFNEAELLAAVDAAGDPAEDEADVFAVVHGEHDAAAAGRDLSLQHQAVERARRLLGHAAAADALPAARFDGEHARIDRVALWLRCAGRGARR